MVVFRHVLFQRLGDEYFRRWYVVWSCFLTRVDALVLAQRVRPVEAGPAGVTEELALLVVDVADVAQF